MLIRRAFFPLLATALVMFAVAPVYIASAPYESTMGFVQKVYYFHVPSGFALFAGALVCGLASVSYLLSGKPSADRLAVAGAELAVLFGLIVLVTGPLWPRKAWGVWWTWDPRLTLSLLLWMIFLSYLMLRRYGGPGTAQMAAAVGVFGMAVVPFVYVSVNVWRTIHPSTSVSRTLPAGMREPFWFCVVAFQILFLTLLALRHHTHTLSAELDRRYVEEA